MNIFVLDSDPVKAASLQVNQSLNTMCKESAQLLSTACRIREPGLGYYRWPSWSKPSISEKRVLYTVTHENHPCAVWARETRTNFTWLTVHGLALCAEWERRFSTHASQKVIEACSRLAGVIPRGPLTPWPLCMPAELQDQDDPVGSYRRFYQSKWYVPGDYFDERK